MCTEQQTWPLVLVEISGPILLGLTSGLVMPDAKHLAIERCRNAGLDGVEFDGGFVQVRINNVLAVENVLAMDEDQAKTVAIDRIRDHLQSHDVDVTLLAFEATVECGPGDSMPEEVN